MSLPYLILAILFPALIGLPIVAVYLHRKRWWQQRAARLGMRLDDMIPPTLSGERDGYSVRISRGPARRGSLETYPITVDARGRVPEAFDDGAGGCRGRPESGCERARGRGAVAGG